MHVLHLFDGGIIMGIFRRSQRKAEKEQAKEVNRESKKTIDGWFRRWKESGQRWADDLHWRKVRHAQSLRIPYFMELCEVNRAEDIDWNHPGVKVGMLICDPVIIRRIQNPKTRAQVYDEEFTDDMWEWYSTACDNKDGRMLRDVLESKWATSKEAMGYVRHSRSSKQ